MAAGTHGRSYSPAPARRSNSDPNITFRTILIKVSQHLTKQDGEQLSFINSLPSTDTPRTCLDVLRELEKRGVYSHDRIDPLIKLLTDINRVDIVNMCGLNEYKETVERTRVFQLEARLSEPVFINHTALDTNSDPCGDDRGGIPGDFVINPSQNTPISSREDTTSPASIATPPSMNQLHSMSVEDKRQLLQQLACDPESKAYMEELVSRENTLVSPPNYGGSDTLTGSDCMQGGVSQFNLSHEQFSMSHDVSGFQGGVASQPEDELLSPKTPSMVLESLPPSFQHQSSISTNMPTKTDPEASLPTQQTNTASLSTSGIGSDLSTLDGPLVMKQMSNTSTASHGVKSLDSPVEEFVSIPHDAYRTTQGSISSATFDEDYPAINKTLTKWKWKRTDLCEPIYKHSCKNFSKEVKMRSSSSLRTKDITLTFVLTPNGLNDNTGCCMTMTVKVDVNKRSKQMREMAQLHLRITSQTEGGTEFLSAKTERNKLETFVVYDFLPHSIVKDSHAKHVEFCVEAYLTHEPLLNTPTS